MRGHGRFKPLCYISCILLLSLACLSSCSAPLRKPNIILITIDALRPDHLSCYGYQRHTSPAIDKFANEAVVFTQSISQSTLTMPSLASLITSVYPTKHGIAVQNADFGKLNYPTIIDILKGKGYMTAVFFPYGKIIADWFRKTTDYLFKYPYTRKNLEAFSNAPFLTSQAITWIRRNCSSPFFAWIHYNEPHAPYTPPFPYNTLYLEDGLYNHSRKVSLGFNSAGLGGIPFKANLNNKEDLDYYIAQYDGEIRYVDYWIGRLLDELKALRLYDGALIIISADHGEGFGEHNLYCEHGMFLYDELIKVPLIMKFPKHSPYTHMVVKKQVRLIDIMPTILSYLHCLAPKHIDGMSLLSLMGSAHGVNNTPLAFSKVDSTNAIRSESWKLIYNEGTHRYELYNLKDDPGEQRNVYDGEQEVSKSLRNKLNSVLNTPAHLEKKSEIKDNDTKNFMKSLGYLQ